MFKDRREAGRELGEALQEHEGRTDVVVLALPRGGVPVAYEVAKRLKVPLDVLVVRKLGLPGWEELAMGAIGPGGVKVLNENVVGQASAKALERVVKAEALEVARREKEYRGGKGELEVSGKTVLVVDDGLATGSSMRAAVEVLRKLGAARIVVAVPVGATTTVRKLRKVADEVVCLMEVEDLGAVGRWYRDFEQTTDEEVMELLQKQYIERQLAGH